MNEMQKQALPGYKDLAEQVTKQEKAIATLSDKQDQTNDLLALLAQCHIDTDNPDTKEGYLEQLIKIMSCIKRNDSVWREKWLESKRLNIRLGIYRVAGLGLLSLLLYLGVLDVNKDTIGFYLFKFFGVHV